jgi:cytochrome c-type biogenesis protein CcsB
MNSNNKSATEFNIDATIKNTSETSQKKISTTQIFAETLDNLSYRILGLGFPFLTIGILSGAVWANEAWGSYWSWDPKETWALLTWLVFAIYLHTRISKGWEGKKPAVIASCGFVVVWACYLGVNLIGEGLHSYGWFSNT